MQQQADITYYDGSVMPFDKASFDAAFVSKSQSTSRILNSFVGEIARILKPDAKLVLSAPLVGTAASYSYDFHRFTRERFRVTFCLAWIC